MQEAGTHTDDRRQEILTAAEKVFDAHGYAAATMDAVAGEAGVSKGTLYNYFDGKAAMFDELLALHVGPIDAEVARMVAQKRPAAERLRNLLDFWFTRVQDFRQIGRLVLEVFAMAAREQDNPQITRRLREMYDCCRGRVDQLLAEGVRNGEFRADLDTHTSASLILAIPDGILIQSILGMDVDVNETLLDAMKRSILQAVQAGPAGRKTDEV